MCPNWISQSAVCPTCAGRNSARSIRCFVCHSTVVSNRTTSLPASSTTRWSTLTRDDRYA
jgi:hypothetical protein